MRYLNLINKLSSVRKRITRESSAISNLSTLSQRIGSVYTHIHMSVTPTFLSIVKYTDLREYERNRSAFSRNGSG